VKAALLILIPTLYLLFLAFRVRAWWMRRPWFIDPARGDDSNHGRFRSRPLRTFRELNRRLRVIRQDTIVNVLSDVPVTDTIRFDGEVRTKKPVLILVRGGRS